jgi:hypothetical protein
VLLVVLWVVLLVCLVLEQLPGQLLRQLVLLQLAVATVASVLLVKLRFKVQDLRLVALGVACLATL